MNQNRISGFQMVSLANNPLLGIHLKKLEHLSERIHALVCSLQHYLKQPNVEAT